MKLVDEIVELAADDKAPISVILRKCLVLAHDLKNERLKDWAGNELNGYSREAQLPSYREVTTIAKGHLLGPYGAQISNQPLPSAALEPKDRHFAESTKLIQPIAAYQPVAGAEGHDAIIEWSANLTLKYQSKILEGYALNRAWQVIPNSVFLGLVDTVRTRVLRLALELRDDLEVVSDDPSEIPPGKVDQIVTNYIFGGTTIIAGHAHDFTQIGSITVNRGDLPGLETALRKLGLPADDVAELTAALATDATGEEAQAVGDRTAAWIKGLAWKFGKAGLKVGVDIATTAATRAITQYLGLP